MNWMILPYQRAFDFQGRSRRMEYWMYTLLQVLILFALVTIVLLTARSGGEDAFLFTLYVVLGVYLLVHLIPNISVQVRRFHDQGLTGFLVLLGFIPYIGGIIVLVFMLIPGTKGPNKYGEDPKRPGVNPEVFA